ncbi:hypothetical protein CAOG_009785 [Capsaspora owczarzaki ATCC 30864]|uniref:Uncharacterized protein n=1 Tax=Capsaspora owczarzaki (strain ATCC 30864) TaxID=595528 RepID=A0A0D2WQN0_CAPO3|nr:hypothetical protein CAOG_009785 [Capsaspora owczarzaki ATCC 30864]
MLASDGLPEASQQRSSNGKTGSLASCMSETSSTEPECLGRRFHLPIAMPWLQSLGLASSFPPLLGRLRVRSSIVSGIERHFTPIDLGAIVAGLRSRVHRRLIKLSRK